ncbi:MAG: ABC transporter permease [Patescibacteria group bacterium]|nr:ABC transporter permease [Patescibacteria group bacterium]MDD4304560.1 ABC transporter permease [Patescibacteria group bacterium]MDD4695747.1 ABC transporter permease [Patescibacteria group bacterium]
MTIKNSIQLAINSMIHNKSRTILTVLGMVIGVSSIIVVFSAGEGIRGLITGQIESFGTNIIETEIRIPTDKNKSEVSQNTGSATGMAQGIQITTMTLKDVEDIEKLPNIKSGYGAIMGQELASYENKRKKIFLMGVNASFIDIDKSEIKEGRFFSDAEDKSLAKVIVLGSKIKQDLFNDSPAVENFITLGKTKYRVIGIMKERGAMMGMDFDNYAYIPIRTIQKKVLGIDYLMYMIHELNNVKLTDDTAQQIKLILRENHNIDNPEDIPALDDFAVVTMEEMMNTLNSITKYITILLLAIVAVSLIVAGVGIMNIMYVVVSERTFEIGLRKAVGAKYLDIMWQFLMEATIISIFGAIIGIIFGIGLSALIALIANKFGIDWRLAIPIEGFLTSIGFAVSCGLIFGVFPAKKAAGLDPITALQK